MRADLLLVERGHATTRSQAQRLIAAGVEWRGDSGCLSATAASSLRILHEATEILDLSSALTEAFP